MKSFLLALVAMAVIATGAYYGLHEVGFSAAERTTVGNNVRLSD
ncbi:hypothetical protein [Oceaniglobus roseus]|nr:hypothetical protein [Kandeliimicrobium roseum]